MDFVNRLESYKRTFVVPDIHADYDAMIRSLENLGIIDDRGEIVVLSGDKIVFLGDYIDRGGKDIEVLEYLIRFAKECESIGVEVVFLMGNHELTVSDILFGAEMDKAVRSQGLLCLKRKNRKLLSSIIDGSEISRFPSISAVRDNLRSDICKFFEALDLLHYDPPFLFIHGGINGATIDYIESAGGINSVNTFFRENAYQDNYEFFGISRHLHPNNCSPLWLRYNDMIEMDEVYEVTQFLRNIGVNTVVVGHKPLASISFTSIDGVNFVDLDVAMSSGFNSTYPYSSPKYDFGGACFVTGLNEDGVVTFVDMQYPNREGDLVYKRFEIK